MSFVDVILFPFVLIYKGFVSILLLPYYLIVGLSKLTGNSKKKELDSIPETKKEKVAVIKGVRKIEPQKKAPILKDPIEIKEEKTKRTLKQQKEFEKLVAKAKAEEIKRIKEQEKLRLAKLQQIQLDKEKEKKRLEKENAAEAKKLAEIEEAKEKGVPYTFSEKCKSFWKKLTYNKSEELKLQAKKEVLDEQFINKKDSTRFEEPIIFNYTARNKNGVLEKSSIEALSRIDVHSFLVSEGYEVYEIIPAKASKYTGLFQFRFKKSRLIFYLTQLSAYLKSGIALADSVKILCKQTKTKKEYEAWKSVYYDLSMGDALSASMAKKGDMFPKLLVNMIRTSEMTGDLIETLDDMVNYYTESETTRKQMISAMTYPIIVTLFAGCVVVFILMWVVPQFVQIYKDLEGELPAITQIVINISDFLNDYLIYIMLALIVLIILYMILYKNVRSFRKTMQEFYMHIPIFGDIMTYNEITIFSKTFANLINHNVFITDSMSVLSKITENEVYKKLIYDTARNLTKGEPISKAFKDHWAFPNIAYQMLITGEKTGRLGTMMERVANYYQEQHKNIIERMKSFIEPILIVSLAVVVGFIMLAVIIPMYGIYDSI